jgi:hypothetical protein
MHPMIAAGFDSLLTLLLFVIIAGVSAWLKKKQLPEDDDSTSQPPPPPPASQRGSSAPRAPRPARPLSWEEELRRLLQGTPETPPPPVIERPLPTPPARSPASTPRPTTPRPPSTARPPSPARPGRLVREKLPGLVTEVARQEETQEKARELERKGHERASSAQVTKRHTAEMQGVHAAEDRLRARALLRDRHSIRSAVMVATLLGPPRALDDRPAYSG